MSAHDSKCSLDRQSVSSITTPLPMPVKPSPPRPHHAKVIYGNAYCYCRKPW